MGLLAVVLVFGCWFESFWSWIAALSFDSFFIVGDFDWFSASRAASSLIGSPVFASSPKANGGSGRVPSCADAATVPP